MKKSLVLSPKHAKKRRERRILRALVGLLLLCGAIGLFAYLMQLPQLRVSEISVSGNNFLTTTAVTNVVMKTFEGKYLGLIPKDALFFYSSGAIETALKNAFARIGAVEVELKDLSVLAVTIEERVPYALWCRGEPTQTDECYFLDKEGTIFAEAPKFSGNVFIHYYGSLDGDEVIGKMYLPDQFKSIAQFVQSVRKMEIPVIALFAEGNGDYQLVIENEGDGGVGRILFNTKEFFDKTLENLDTIWHQKISLGTKNPPLPVDYIDLRYGNKVYLKVR